MAALDPFPKPMGIFPKYITQTPETFVLKERVLSLSGDSFDVKTVDGRPFLKIKGRRLTMSGRKTVTDEAGDVLFDIVQRRLHLHATYVAEDPSGKELLEVKNAFNLVGSKANVSILSSDGVAEMLSMKGNWRDTTADIICESTGAVVARIDRKLLTVRELFGQQSYALTVAPGVDQALMVAACVALDEKNNE